MADCQQSTNLKLYLHNTGSLAIGNKADIDQKSITNILKMVQTLIHKIWTIIIICVSA